MKTNKIFYCIICLVSVLILIWSFLRNNLVEKFWTTNTEENKNNFENTNMYVLYIPKREKHIRDIMKKLKLEPEFIKGPDKNKLDLKKLIENNEITQNYGIDKNKGRIACHLGHLKILNNFLHSNKKYALIFEDDIKIDNYNDTNNKIINLINNIPPNADIVYFGYCWEKCDKTTKYNDYFNYSHLPLCRHCYLVSRNGAQIIINNSNNINDTGDTIYYNLIKSNKLISYNVNMNYLIIEQNRSIIGSELNNNDSIKICI